MPREGQQRGNREIMVMLFIALLKADTYGTLLGTLKINSN
jgi:hypothetical protein